MKQLSETPKANPISEKLAKTKLEKDLNKIILNINPTNEGILTFDMMGKFMRCIGIYKILYNPEYHVLCRPNGEFIYKQTTFKNDKFYTRKDKELEFQINTWGLLKRNHKGYIDAELLIELILLLATSYMDNYDSLIFDTVKLFKAADNAYGKMEYHGEIHLICKQLIKSYRELNPGRLIISIPKESIDQELTFHPKINEKSRRMADMNLNNYKLFCNQSLNISTDSEFDSRIMMMYDKKRAVDDMCEYLRNKKEQNELNECTFKPKLNPYKFRSYSAKRDLKRCKTTEELEFEKCTFNPMIYRRNLVSSKINTPKGYDEAVKRLREAERENVRKNLEKEKIPTGTNYQKVRMRKPQIPAMCYRKSNMKKPLLKINVDITDHKKGLIIINKGDDLYKVVSDFARIFKISEKKTEDLYEKIKRCTKKLICR